MNFRSTAASELSQKMATLMAHLSDHEHGKLIQRSLKTLIDLSEQDLDRLDWKILSAALQDMARGFEVFHPYRHTRKVAIFGSSRLTPTSQAYQMAVQFAQAIIERGFMVMTGAGGGIMEAGNAGATAEHSFGLNIQLPFEQSTNPYIAGDAKLIDFKYFFTRKLFFLRETDAIAVFPGGFGTLDEAFECLTLGQTGKSPPIPVVLVAPPGSNYWQDWDTYIRTHLTAQQLISPEDHRLYSVTDSVEQACNEVANFYRVYHSSRYVGDRFVIRLNCAISDTVVDRLNQDFQDILISGAIQKSDALWEERSQSEPQPKQDIDRTESLPRLVFHFNQRDHGRLYQLISQLNDLESLEAPACHPERK
ncbi:LOG family protein [Lyngbya confervoides]|uniref:LOG family protein n=1 Tax=Lyngbya confervoides BDU141951 TaxID=1574623 RepID=A0ABD4SZF3_9CYAN|nr:LOG family protein [Lyngbya confervoides]MCM1981490.1 LOG family protein [Lyngbya confervoides BDU141951]